MSSGRRVVATTVASLVTAGALLTSPALAAAANPAHGPGPQAVITNPEDFNNDGYADLVIGAPFDDVTRNGTAYPGAGVVTVLYGGANGLHAMGSPHSQLWSQDGTHVADKTEKGDHFGWALAKGDFDADGFSDLAIGVPGEDVGGQPDVGGVNILYGSASGLIADARQPLVTGGGDPDYADQRMGTSLVAFETNNDAAMDLAAGAPGRDSNEGSVWVFRGSYLDPDASDGNYSVKSLDQAPGCLVGTSLAAGDFDINPLDDLAVGAPGCDTHNAGTQKHAGAVFVLFEGSGSSVEVLKQDAGFLDIPETGDRLGTSVAIGDVNGDGIPDLIAGAPGEDLGGKADAGIVSVALRTSDQGAFQLPAHDITRKSLDTSNVAGAHFGATLAIGPLGGSASALVVGAPGDAIGSVKGAGTVWVRPSSGVGVQHWSQDSTGVLDKAESGDAFGSSLAIGDYDQNATGDLAIGVPKEDVGAITDAGAVSVLYASGIGQPLSSGGDDLWTQDSPGVGEAAQRGDRFGFAVR